MDHKTVVHLYNGILYSRKKGRTPTLHNSIDRTGEHYAKWNKPGSETQIPYDLTYNWKLINKTNKWAKYRTRDLEIKYKQTVTRLEDEGDKGGKEGRRYVQAKEHEYRTHGDGQWKGFSGGVGGDGARENMGENVGQL